MSRKLINYIVDELILIDNDDVIKLIVNNKCGLDDNCLTVLKTGLEMEYQKNLKKCKRTNIKQIILMILGILFLFISTIFKENFVFQEVFLIIGWVPIWEVINIELFNDVKDKRKRKVLKRILESNFELVN